MSIYDLKPKFQKILMPIIYKLHKKGISPNQVTIWAIILSLVGGIVVYISYFNKYFLILIPLILFVRMALNAIDGVLARKYNQMTKKGAVLNELGDVISDTVLYAPFAFFLDPIYVLVFIVLSILSEFAGILSWAVYGIRKYDGPLGKSDRAFLIGVVSLLIAFYDFIIVSNIIFIIASLLLIFTIYNRVKENK